MNVPIERKVDQFRLLTETGPDTPMGKLLRQFWHPIALASELPVGKARSVRVLGEDLTLYRGEGGKAFLVGGRCAHRCTVLHTGQVKDDQIRCMYHGWRYDGTGLCTEIPAESLPRSKPIRIAGYAVHEYCGLLFAYLGVAPAPEFDLPRKEVFEKEGLHIIATRQLWDCNWFQHVENSMDPLHLGFAHFWGKPGQFGSAVTTLIPELTYTETTAGVRQVATRSKDNVRISDWTFPNNNHVIAPGPRSEDPWAHVSAWPTPVDDFNTIRFTLYALPVADPSKIAELMHEYDIDYEPTAHYDELFYKGQVSGVHEPGLISIQDYVAVRGQGVICDRSEENLSTSDAGIAFARRIFLRELELIRQGRPTKNWTRLIEALHLPTPPSIQAAE